ncbi:hypothetical protein GOBAR_DD03413 [Gossypium barbadense]|nr:hypothetical protein GOBAR_DD03413 [Gossypium barbadense]
MLTFEGQKIQGSQSIVAKLSNLPFQWCQHSITVVDCQPSGVGGMLVFVSGTLQLIRMETPSGIKDSIPAWIKFSVQAPGEIPNNGIYYDPPEERFVLGESAQMVENSLNIHGDEILYVGDHIYTDVSQFKVHLRWRTALICRELEEEYKALIHSRGPRATVVELINQKEVVGDLFNQLRLALQRRTKGRPAQTLAATNMDDRELTENMQKLLIVMQRLQYSLLLAQLFAQHGMSKVGEEFMAGVLDHLPSILAFTAPLPNRWSIFNN